MHVDMVIIRQTTIFRIFTFHILSNNFKMTVTGCSCCAIQYLAPLVQCFSLMDWPFCKEELMDTGFVQFSTMVGYIY